MLVGAVELRVTGLDGKPQAAVCVARYTDGNIHMVTQQGNQKKAKTSRATHTPLMRHCMCCRLRQNGEHTQVKVCHYRTRVAAHVAQGRLRKASRAAGRQLLAVARVVFILKLIRTFPSQSPANIHPLYIQRRNVGILKVDGSTRRFEDIMNIKATVLLFAVVAVCTVTMIQSRMTRNTDNDDDNYPSNNQRRDTDDNDNDDGDSKEWSNTQRSDRNDNDNDDDDRSTRYPSNNQRGDRDDNDNDKDYRSTKSPSNNQRGARDDNDNDNDYRSTKYPSNNQRGDRDDNDNDKRLSQHQVSVEQPASIHGVHMFKTNNNITCACFAVDLAFSVDASGSIVRENWSRVTAFINRAIAGMEVSPSCARVSIVTFGNAATLQFDLLAHDNAASLHRAIAGLGMLNQSRNLADGISTVRSDVFQDFHGDRQDAPNVCVLITDGNSGFDKQ
ncbi:hypothetical protein LSAT2_032886, partial [Lamellibrachia satsuma]